MPRTRTPPTPAEIVSSSMQSLERAVRNLLVDNKNFASGHYAAEFPRTAEFIAQPLKGMAEHIIGKIDEVRELAMQMAAYPDIPGMIRSHTGMLHGHGVSVWEAGGGTWKVDISVPLAFHAGDDFTGTYAEEEEALAVVSSFAVTGEIPASMRPAGEDE